MKISPVAILALLVSCIGLTLPIFPAYAAPSLVQQRYGANSPSSLTWTVAFSGNTVSGNVLIANILVRNCCLGGSNTNPAITTITDTQGNTWTKQVAATSNWLGDATNTWGTEIWSTTAKSSAADTVTFNVNVGPAQSSSDFAIIKEWSGISSGAAASGTASGSRSTNNGITSATTNSSVSFNSGGMEDSAGYFGACAMGSAGTSFTNYQGAAQGALGANQIAEYSTSVGSPTSFPSTCNTTQPYLDVGAAFTSSSLVTNVVACTFFQLQCWWYPMLFLGSYTGMWMLVAFIGRASVKGKTYMMLAALTLGSLIEVKMGMIPATFPIMLTVLSIIYAVRYR